MNLPLCTPKFPRLPGKTFARAKELDADVFCHNACSSERPSRHVRSDMRSLDPDLPGCEWTFRSLFLMAG
jgi:hypothetical protein